MISSCVKYKHKKREGNSNKNYKVCKMQAFFFFLLKSACLTLKYRWK